VRVALGATRLAIASMILRDGIRVVATGCVFGAALSWLVARIVQTLIVGQAVVGPTVFVAVACLLLFVGITASLRPAQRAAAADPIKALRYE
jgi:putative ABC transport system permease protein